MNITKFNINKEAAEHVAQYQGVLKQMEIVRKRYESDKSLYEKRELEYKVGNFLVWSGVVTMCLSIIAVIII